MPNRRNMLQVRKYRAKTIQKLIQELSKIDESLNYFYKIRINLDKLMEILKTGNGNRFQNAFMRAFNLLNKRKTEIENRIEKLDKNG